MTAVQLDQSQIWYSACNEDSTSEIAALDPGGKQVLCITASGSRCFDLLLADPSHVTSIDQNAAQTALAELFAAAYRRLDYADFAVLAGLRQTSNRLALLKALLPDLNAPGRAFWDRNHAIASDGLLYCGKWEGFLRRFQKWSGHRRRQLAKALLGAGSLPEQQSLWRDQWDDWQWRLFLRCMAMRPLWRHVLKEPGIAFVPHDFDMAGYAHARFDHAANTHHLAHLPFAWLLLAGEYRNETLPPYLTEQGHAVISGRIDRISFRTESLQDTLAASGHTAFDAVSLSDYSSYCSEMVQREVWSQLSRCVRHGGRVCERKFFNKSGTTIPNDFGFTRDEALEKALTDRDGAFFYSFVVAQKV